MPWVFFAGAKQIPTIQLFVLKLEGWLDKWGYNHKKKTKETTQILLLGI